MTRANFIQVMLLICSSAVAYFLGSKSEKVRRAGFVVAELIKPCVLAGCPPGGVVLDPFFGSGTTGEVALEYGRNVIGIELNPEYIPLIEDRLRKVTPGFLI